MKVELNLNQDTILAINNVLINVYYATKEIKSSQKVYVSIAYDIAEKIDKKAKTLLKNATLFDTKKKHKITIKYHEAWALYHILIDFIPTEQNPYTKNLLQQTFDFLNQKLV